MSAAASVRRTVGLVQLAVTAGCAFVFFTPHPAEATDWAARVLFGMLALDMAIWPNPSLGAPMLFRLLALLALAVIGAETLHHLLSV